MFDQISRILVEKLAVLPTDVTPQTRLEDLTADSLDRVEVIIALEAEFGVEIPDDEFEEVATVHDIEQLIAEKFRRAKASAS